MSAKNDIQEIACLVILKLLRKNGVKIKFHCQNSDKLSMSLVDQTTDK